MNRIDNKFKDLKKINKKALIAFITCGDPDLDTTEKLILEMEQQGVNIIELGVPFSDPLADGPTIQEASQRALANKITLNKILKFVKNLRKKTDIPLVLMTYYNPVYKFGIEKLGKSALKSGIDGLTSRMILSAMARASADIPTDPDKTTLPSGRIRETSTTARSIPP